MMRDLFILLLIILANRRICILCLSMTTMNLADDDDDELLINYHDACIYGRDVRLLENPRAWLNDACLHYQCVRLQQTYDSNDVLFLDPSVVFCLVHQLEDVDEFQQFAAGYPTLKTTCRKVLLPINDTLAHTTASLAQHPPAGTALGTHWSLLLIVLPLDHLSSSSSCRYLHFDSSPSSGNCAAAQAVAQQWNVLWNCATNTAAISDAPPPHVQQAKTPSQTNGYDCGVHVLLAAQMLADMDDNELLEERLGTALRDNPRLCLELRQEMARDIRQRVAARQTNENTEDE